MEGQVDSQLLAQIMNQIPPEVLGQMIAEINDPKRFVRRDMLSKELPDYLNKGNMVGGSNAPLRV